MLTRLARLAPSLRLRKMSDIASLTNLFENALHLQLSDKKVENQVAFDKFPEPQQKQIHNFISIADKLPGSVSELNDALRTNTYLLGTQQPTEIDAIILARVGRYVAAFSDVETAQNRHVVRWLDQVQNVLNVTDKIPVNKDVTVEREIKQKPKKVTAEGTAGAKPDSKAAKGDPKAIHQEGTAPAKASGETPDSGITGAAAGTEVAGAAPAAKEKKPKEKKEKPKKEQPAKPAARAVTPGLIDLRVGFIEKAIRHPDADTLYVSTINVGEDEPRTICSGLVNFVPIEDMQKRQIVVVANLKPVKMRGIFSNGMVLCASTHDHTKVEFINPPAGSKPGDKIFFETYDEEPEAQLNPKKKHWEQIQPGFTTTEDLEVVYNKEGEPPRKLVNKNGDILRASTIKNAFVS